jgi:uridine kinase
VREISPQPEVKDMVDMKEVVARIVRKRAMAPARRSLLVGLSGIDGSGKGFVAKQIEARLAQHSISAANINADGWLNLPDKRFNSTRPAQHFYENAIRFDEMFTRLLLPLRECRSVNLVADFAEETAKSYRQRTYSFKNVGVVLLEGIFLFKREHRKLFDLAIWVDCSFATALSRALARAQEGLSPAQTIRAYEAIYFPAQRIHIERDRPQDYADLIVDNDPFMTRPLRYQRNLRAMAASLAQH